MAPNGDRVYDQTDIEGLQNDLLLLRGTLTKMAAAIQAALDLIEKAKRHDAQGLAWRPLLKQAQEELSGALTEAADEA